MVKQIVVVALMSCFVFATADAGTRRIYGGSHWSQHFGGKHFGGKHATECRRHH